MTGRLIAVVGPSGVGKDSLIAGLAQARPDLHVVRRVITRPTEAGGEPFEGVPADEFLRRHAAGAFCMSWAAHGLSYGVPREMLDVLASGRDAVVNLSRGVLGQASTLADDFLVLRVSAAPETLALRLAMRGRESEEDILRRLKRTEPDLPDGLRIVTIRNDGALDEAVAAALEALYPARV